MTYCRPSCFALNEIVVLSAVARTKKAKQPIDVRRRRRHKGLARPKFAQRRHLCCVMLLGTRVRVRIPRQNSDVTADNKTTCRIFACVCVRVLCVEP